MQTHRFNFFCNAEEAKRINDLAKARGLSVSALLRVLALEEEERRNATQNLHKDSRVITGI